MRFRRQSLRWIAWMASVGCALLVTSRPTRAQAPPQPEAGLEVLSRGPIHEAFAEPVVFDPTPGPIAPKEPLEAVEELPPDEKPAGDNVVWIPGYWNWDEERNDFIWVSGFWRLLPPGREWVPGYWISVSGGFQWVSGYWAPVGGETALEYLPEPPPGSIEAGPSTAPPTVEHVWAPGSWYWADTRYVWRPGYWMVAQPDWIWVPAYYLWTPRGYVFVDGYWDHAAPRRGLLFAPVYFDRRVYVRRAYYTPTVVINADLALNHFFVRPRFHHYYFGDYYADNYVKVGIYPWFAFHNSRYGYDPIYAYYRQTHRREPDWDRRLREAYRERHDHVDARPPRTFAALTVSAERRGRDRDELSLVARLDQFRPPKDTGMRLEKVDAQRRKEFAKRAVETRQFAQERIRLESGGPTNGRERLPAERPSKEVRIPEARPKEEGRVKEGRAKEESRLKGGLAKEGQPKDNEPLKLRRSKSPIVGPSLSDKREGFSPPPRPEPPKPDLKAQSLSRGKGRPRPDPDVTLRQSKRGSEGKTEREGARKSEADEKEKKSKLK